MKFRNCDKIERKLLSFNIHINLSGKRARKNLNDNARNEKEMESLITKEDERPMTGVYPDHCYIGLSISWPFLVRKIFLKQTNKKQNQPPHVRESKIFSKGA